MTKRKKKPIDMVREVHEEEPLPEHLQDTVDSLVKRFPQMENTWKEAAHSLVKTLGRDQFEDKDND